MSDFATPWTVARQAPLSMEFCWQEYWSGLPCPPPEDLPNQGLNPCLLCLLHWQVVFTISATWEAFQMDEFYQREHTKWCSDRMKEIEEAWRQMAWHMSVTLAPSRQLGNQSLDTVSWTKGQSEKDQGQLCTTFFLPYNQLISLQILAWGGYHDVHDVDAGRGCSFTFS